MDDDAAARLPHLRKNRPNHLHGAEYIGLELLKRFFTRNSFEDAVLAVSGIVEQNVDSAETIDSFRYSLPDAPDVLNIQPVDQNIPGVLCRCLKRRP